MLRTSSNLLKRYRPFPGSVALVSAKGGSKFAKGSGKRSGNWMRSTQSTGGESVKDKAPSKRSLSGDRQSRDQQGPVKDLTSSTANIPEPSPSLKVKPLTREPFRVSPITAFSLLRAFDLRSGLVRQDGSNPSKSGLLRFDDSRWSVQDRNFSKSKILVSAKLNFDASRFSVRGTLNLPHGIPADVTVAVFCFDIDSEEMLRLGADFAGVTTLTQKIAKGWAGFDRCFASPDTMPQVMPLARVLGPKKLMPNPKSGTLVTDLRKALLDAKSGKSVEYRADEFGVVTVPLGNFNFSQSMLYDNFRALMKELRERHATIFGATNASAGAGSEGALQGGLFADKISAINREIIDNGYMDKPNRERLERFLAKVDKQNLISSSVLERYGFGVKKADTKQEKPFLGDIRIHVDKSIDPEAVQHVSDIHMELQSAWELR